MPEKELDEKRIEPNYPVYGDYTYVAILEDGSEVLVASHLTRGTAQELIRDLRNAEGWYKKPLRVDHLKTCDLLGRGLLEVPTNVEVE